MSNFLQLSVKLLVWGYYCAFQTLRIVSELVKMYLCLLTNRSSHQKCSLIKGVLRNLAIFTRKHQCLRAATLLKKWLCHWCFPVNFVKQNTSGELLLKKQEKDLKKEEVKQRANELELENGSSRTTLEQF